MLFFWRIRYLDSRDRQFKNRNLYLDTGTLDPVTRAAAECAREIGSDASHKGMLKFRHLFREDTLTLEERHRLLATAGACDGFCVPDYFEDEHGKPLSNRRMAQILTGNPNAIMFPPGYRSQDIELCLAAPSAPVDFGQVSLTQIEVDCLAYFTRDVKELRASEFYRNGPGTLHKAGGPFQLETATTPDEVRSFVTVFRRLYMVGEPGSFKNAATLFAEKVPHPSAKWMGGELADYEQELNGKPDFYPPKRGIAVTFTRKGILDAFIYTKFAHQPQQSRIRQYKKHLEQVPSETVLTWLFLTSAYRTSFHYVNALQHIEPFLAAYLRAKDATPSFSRSGLHEESGLGSVEKRAAKRQRILREKAKELALKLWQDAGRPPGGPATFLRDAEKQLRDFLGT